MHIGFDQSPRAKYFGTVSWMLVDYEVQSRVREVSRRFSVCFCQVVWPERNLSTSTERNLSTVDPIDGKPPPNPKS